MNLQTIEPSQPSKTETIATNNLPIETASTVMSSPDHPQFSGDKAVAITLAQGKSGLIAAIDGVGSEGEASSQAAQIMQAELSQLSTQLIEAPTINTGVDLLSKAIIDAQTKIKQLPSGDTTISASLVCESPNHQTRFLLIANVGDSRHYRFRPSQGTTDQLTTDHSIVQKLVEAGRITQNEAFAHPQRNVIYLSVRDLKSSQDIDFTVTEIQAGDIFLAVTDGVSDNITPTGLPAAALGEYRKAFDSQKNMCNLKKFSFGLAQRARNIQTGTRANHAKPDDICVSVLKTPRVI